MVRVPGLALTDNPQVSLIRHGLVCCVVFALISLWLTRNAVADPLVGSAEYEINQPTGNTTDTNTQSPLLSVMQSIVTVEANVSSKARTAKNFGVMRSGSGVVLDSDGLVVTAGYLIAEAESVAVTFSDGIKRTADVVAFDSVSGLGLIRVTGGQTTVPIAIGNSGKVAKGDLAMIIPASGETGALAVKVGEIKKYSGGWEYIVDNALHTFPPTTEFTGAALVSESAELLGVGGLVTIDIDIDPKIRVPGNIFIPVNTLMSTIGQLLVDGRSQASHRPWIGLDTKNTKQGVAVSSFESDAPAKLSDLRGGDIIVAVSQKKVSNQIDFYEKIWKLYKPGEVVELLVLRGDEYQSISVTSMDYYDWLHDPAQSTQLSELSE